MIESERLFRILNQALAISICDLNLANSAHDPIADRPYMKMIYGLQDFLATVKNWARVNNIPDLHNYNMSSVYFHLGNECRGTGSNAATSLSDKPTSVRRACRPHGCNVWFVYLTVDMGINTTQVYTNLTRLSATKLLHMEDNDMGHLYNVLMTIYMYVIGWISLKVSAARGRVSSPSKDVCRKGRTSRNPVISRDHTWK